MKVVNKINTLVRLDGDVKKGAQKAAARIGLPLSTIINNYLYHFSKDNEIAFEYPSPRLIAMLEESEKDVKNGKVSPAFSNAKEAMKWLNAQ